MCRAFFKYLYASSRYCQKIAKFNLILLFIRVKNKCNPPISNTTRFFYISEKLIQVRITHWILHSVVKGNVIECRLQTRIAKLIVNCNHTYT